MGLIINVIFYSILLIVIVDCEISSERCTEINELNSTITYSWNEIPGLCLALKESSLPGLIEFVYYNSTITNGIWCNKYKDLCWLDCKVFIFIDRTQSDFDRMEDLEFKNGTEVKCSKNEREDRPYWLINTNDSQILKQNNWNNETFNKNFMMRDIPSNKNESYRWDFSIDVPEVLLYCSHKMPDSEDDLTSILLRNIDTRQDKRKSLTNEVKQEKNFSCAKADNYYEPLNFVIKCRKNDSVPLEKGGIERKSRTIKIDNGSSYTCDFYDTFTQPKRNYSFELYVINVKINPDTTSTTKKPKGQPKNCVGKGIYGEDYHAEPGSSAKSPCVCKSNENIKTIKCDTNKNFVWECSNEGKWLTIVPNNTNCLTVWLENITVQVNEDIKKNPVIELKTATEYVNQIYENVNKTKYEGHEVENILDVSITILDHVNNNFSCSEEMAKMMDLKRNDTKALESFYELLFNTTDLMLRSDLVWNQTNANKIIYHDSASRITGRMLSALDLYGFDLLEKIKKFKAQCLNKTSESYKYPFKSEKDMKTVFVESGIMNSDTEQVLKLPSGSTKSDSHIQFPSNWVTTDFKNENEGVKQKEVKYTFVQISESLIEGKIKRIAESGDLDICSKKETEDIKISSLIGISLNSPKNNNEEFFRVPGSKFKIIFKHKSIEQDILAKYSKCSGKNMKRQCVFVRYENHTNPENNKCTYWSYQGCVVLEYTQDRTVCECDHLTNFAVMFGKGAKKKNDDGLKYLTIALMIISIICLILNIIIISFQKVKKIQANINKNLSICLIGANLCILLFLDKSIIFNYIEDENIRFKVCYAAGLISHYIWLAAFCWMAVNGIQLFKIVFFVFNKRTFKVHYNVGAYGIPTIIVAITATIGHFDKNKEFENECHTYGGENYCWLNGSYIWAFLAPVTFIIFMNIVAFIVTLKKSFDLNKSLLKNKRVKTCRTRLSGSLSLTIMLGLTWIFGYLQIIEDEGFQKIASYLFVILNGSQGISILIFNCYLNENVRNGILKSIRTTVTSQTVTSSNTDKNDTGRKRKQVGKGDDSTSSNFASSNSTNASNYYENTPVFQKRIMNMNTQKN